MLRVRRQSLVFICALLLCGTALAQSILQPDNAIKPQAASPEPLGTIHAEANLVLVDVVVTQNGQPVHGLDKSRFQIFEDGRPQKIVTFDESSAPKPSLAVETAAPLPPNVYSNIPRYPVADAVNVILLDSLNTPLLERDAAERQLVRFLAHATPGTMIAVYSLGNKLTLEANFTADPAELFQTIQKMSSRPQPTLMDGAKGHEERIVELQNAPDDFQKQHGLFLECLRNDEAGNAAEDAATRVRTTLKAMEELAEILQTIPGRKNLIWISGAFPLALAPNMDLKNPFASMRSFGPELESTARKLASERVAVYAIDALGLVGLPSTDTTVRYNENGGKVLKGGRVKMAGDSDDTKFLSGSADTRASIRAIADATGGKAYLNTNGISEAIASAVSNGQNYFTLGYIPSEETLNGGFHKIQVKIPGTRFELSYRKGYPADRTGQTPLGSQVRGDSLTFSTDHGAPPSTQIGFQVRILPITDPMMKGVAEDKENTGDLTAAMKGAKTLYVADLLVDVQALAFDKTKAGLHTGKLEIMLNAFDHDGKPVNHLYRLGSLQVPDGQFADVLQRGVLIRMELYLPSGYCFLRFAIRDPLTKRIGSLEIPMNVMARSS